MTGGDVVDALESPDVIDLEALIDQGAWGGFQKFVLVLVALAFVIDGWANQVLGVAMPALISDLGHGHGRAAFASVFAVSLVGFGFGNALGGILGDRLGRRVSLIGSVLLFGAATCAVSQVHSIAALATLRFFDGLGLGAAVPVGAALVSEFTPMRRKGLALGCTLTFNPVGGVLAGLGGSWLLPSMGWRPLFLLTGGAALALAFFFLLVLAESPHFLIEQPHRKADLLKLLNRLGHRFSADRQFQARRSGEAAPISALLGRSLRHDTLALWAGFFTSLMASYSMLSWLPTMLSDRGFGLAQASFSMTVLSGAGIFGAIMAGVLLTAFGSRLPSVLLNVGAALGAVTLGLIPLHPQHGATLAMSLLAVEGVFLAGQQMALYTVAANVYPAFMRSTGIGSASAIGRIGAVTSSFSGAIAITLANGSFYFLYIAVLFLLCSLAVGLLRSHMSAQSQPAARMVRRHA